jgi:hypothetical protein
MLEPLGCPVDRIRVRYVASDSGNANTGRGCFLGGGLKRFPVEVD